MDFQFGPKLLEPSCHSLDLNRNRNQIIDDVMYDNWSRFGIRLWKSVLGDAT